MDLKSNNKGLSEESDKNKKNYGRFNVIDEKFNTQNSKLDNLNSTIKWVGGILSAIIGAILVKFLLG